MYESYGHARVCTCERVLGAVRNRAVPHRAGTVPSVNTVKVLPDPAIVLASDYQVSDLVRFGTSNVQHCVLTIDPTFSLGEFEVTPVTYRHLLLESRRTGKSPICVGPILIHYRKTFPTYLFFSSSMIGLQRELVSVKSIGTDGEEALSDAFSHGFKSAVHLTCQIHKRRNVEAKLKDMGFPLEARHHILDDIFGKQRGDTFYEGLVDWFVFNLIIKFYDFV